MKNSKIICVLLVLIAIVIIPLQASAFEYGENDFVIDYIPGDIDGNERVTAADARLCIRAAASLETLTAEQVRIADVDGDGVITSANARAILRAGAKLAPLDVTVIAKAGQRVIVGPYVDYGAHRWDCAADSDNTAVERIFEDNLPEGYVGMFDQFYTITSQETEAFTVKFTNSVPWTGEMYFSFNLTVKFE